MTPHSHPHGRTAWVGAGPSPCPLRRTSAPSRLGSSGCTQEETVGAAAPANCPRPGRQATLGCTPHTGIPRRLQGSEGAWQVPRLQLAVSRAVQLPPKSPWTLQPKPEARSQGLGKPSVRRPHCGKHPSVPWIRTSGEAETQPQKTIEPAAGPDHVVSSVRPLVCSICVGSGGAGRLWCGACQCGVSFCQWSPQGSPLPKASMQARSHW